MKVLIVDDSVVFRSQISTALANVPNIEVVGTAANGKLALQRLDQMQVDLMTLDMEMPEMNGIETLKALRARNSKVKVIVFSSQTIRGAEKALEALREGADDVVAKPEGDTFNFESAATAVRSALLPKIIQFKDQKLVSLRTNTEGIPTVIPSLAEQLKKDLQAKAHKSVNPKQNLNLVQPQAIVIASSTGGPSALEKIFSQMRAPFRIPIFITQHMPPVFTQILAKRIGELTGSVAKEGENGELAKKGVIYLAPGDFHMEIEMAHEGPTIRLNQKPLRCSVRPCADHMFESAARVYRRGLMGVVLTGMGEDGAAGSKAVRDEQGAIMIQNKESCVVWGMPGSVFDLDEYDEVGDLEKIVGHIRHMAQGI
jgi:two-component system chemotaxis response regulator CheB